MTMFVLPGLKTKEEGSNAGQRKGEKAHGPSVSLRLQTLPTREPRFLSEQRLQQSKKQQLAGLP
jgi:hypothetical protein